MYASKNILIVLFVIWTGLAQADVIVKWGDGSQGTEWFWNLEENTLRILRGDGNDYKFWFHDGSETPGTGVIDNIVVDPNAVGDFTLTIAYPLYPNDPNSPVDPNQPGALDWNEGDLRYAGGTSTVLGVKLAGNLADTDQYVYLDQLDGSIEVDGSMNALTINEWLGASPDAIRVAGDVVLMAVNDDCPGDIDVGGDLTLLIYGDMSGSLDVGDVGNVHIYGDLVDSGTNHARIATLRGFNCENMELGGDRERWLTFGPRTSVNNELIRINGALSGVIRFRDRYEGEMIIDTIAAGATTDTSMQYGGIYFEHGSSPDCSVTVSDSFVEGWIFAENSTEAEGAIAIWGDMGQASPPTVARIITGYAATLNDPVIDYNWRTFICGNVWPSADAEPAIYCTGHFNSSIEIGYPLENCDGTVKQDAVFQIDGDVNSDAEFAFHDNALSGSIIIGGNYSGRLECGGQATTSHIQIGGDYDSDGYMSMANRGVKGVIDILGDMSGELSIRIGTAYIDGGQIRIHGSLNDGPSSYEIRASDIVNGGSITVDYDGWDDGDEWDPNAVIRIGATQYTQNTPSMQIWEAMRCKGNANNSGTDDDIEAGQLDPNDPNALMLYINDPEDYEAAFPGLSGSMLWRGDIDCDTIDPNDPDIDTDDLAALEWLLEDDCCMKSCQFNACYADIFLDAYAQVNLADLTQLLGHYGMTSGATRSDGDIEPIGGDGDVDLADLGDMLAVYGAACDCHAGAYRDSAESSSSHVDFSVAAVNTNGHTGGGFVGEVDHFVFDLKIEVNEPRYDDWIATGADLDGANDATFRLSSTATTPDQYATFVAAPWTSLPGSATASVAGTYDPADPSSVFTASAVNLGWYDTNAASNDGPATVMRIVIDVSEVDGADVSSGFGSVYFSTSGPTDQGDILVAELNSGAGTKLTGGLKTFWGEFYVKGE